MMSGKGRRSSSKRPRLISREWTETSGENEVRVRVLERGLLRRETRSAVLRSISELKSPNLREQFNVLCNKLRDELEELGVPSDRNFFWMTNGKGEWVPLELPPGRSSVALSSNFANWKARLNSLTEPLTLEQATGELLYQLRQLLARDCIDPHLPRIWAAMRAYAEYRLAGEVNILFDDAIGARKGRSHGPNAIKRRANATRQVIAKHAEDYWSTHPDLLNDASNTAACITDDVNRSLAAQGLLPGKKTRLSVKTIGDHIRAHLKG